MSAGNFWGSVVVVGLLVLIAIRNWPKDPKMG